MLKNLSIFLTIAAITLIIDQIIKQIFIDGYRLETSCITFSLVYNRGVAFSMFEFLGDYLKYIQIVILAGIVAFLFWERERFGTYGIGLAFVLGGGASNILDRFIHIGVVDYVYWHCGFDFAIFNLADVMIDFGIVILLIKILRENK